MLGQMVNLYFKKQGYEVLTYDQRFSESSIIDYVEEINKFEDAIIFNCIGKIKQKSEDPFNLIWSNTILPLALARDLKDSHFLIHPSTDCVFNGLEPNSYEKNHVHDANDLYGWSKSLGETAIRNRKNSLIIRVSIIGLDRYSNKGLLSWFLNNPSNSKIEGFLNHYWNGISTLEWCKVVHDLILNRNIFHSENKTVQIGTTEFYSKYEMLLMFQEVFEKDFVIEPVQNLIKVNRRLTPDLIAKELKLQLIELKEFWDKFV